MSWWRFWKRDQPWEPVALDFVPLFRPDPLVCPWCLRVTYRGLLILAGKKNACHACVETNPVLAEAREKLMLWNEQGAAVRAASVIVKTATPASRGNQRGREQ